MHWNISDVGVTKIGGLRQRAGAFLFVCCTMIVVQSHAQPLGTEEGFDQPAHDRTAMEESPSSGSAGEPGDFDLMMVNTNASQWTAVRINTRSGQSWRFSQGDIWKPIYEPDGEPLVASQYLIRSTRFGESKSAIIRMDSKSGKSWFLKGNRWLPIPVFSD